MIIGILLAAGAASRFGGGKLLARLPDGRCVAETACARLRAGVDHVVAVVRSGDDELASRLVASGAEVHRFADAHLGMGASLAFGVACASQADGWLIALADMPMIATADVARVAAALRDGAALVIPECQGKRGHPVGFSHRFGDELRALQGDQGARSLIQRHAAEVQRVPVDDEQSWLDIDTPEELERVCCLSTQEQAQKQNI